MSARLGPPIFVVGYMHSGTTLLFRIIERAEGVFASTGETRFFEALPEVRRRHANLERPSARQRFIEACHDNIRNRFHWTVKPFNPKPEPGMLSPQDVETLVRATESEPEPARIFCATFDQLARRAGCSRWVEKTPTHLFCAGEIWKARPNTLFVEIVRDPRDVIASKKLRQADAWKTHRYGRATAYKRLEKAYHPVWDALSWRSAIAAGDRARAMRPAQWRRIRYEDLVADPERQVRGLCRFLGLEFRQAMLRAPAGEAAEGPPGPGERGVSARRAGRWKTTLSGGETPAVQTTARGGMASAGYEPVACSPRDRAAAALWFLTSPFAILSRLWKRLRLGGPRYLLAVLRQYAARLKALRKAACAPYSTRNS